MQIITQGERRITREQILAQGKIPVSPGIPQEQAEKAYWRRRVVEACIHGVDINPMAVELAKLSLWLTCIAADEPLNFLDHHLRHGNALLFVAPEELKRAPILGPEPEHRTFELGAGLHNVLAGVIRDAMRIEEKASTEMDVVKEKEHLWKEALTRLQPFLDLSHLWIAALDGVPVDELNYLSAARLLVDPDQLPPQEARDAKRFIKSIAEDLESRKNVLSPFHWQLEFPDVFFDEAGQPLLPASVASTPFSAIPPTYPCTRPRSPATGACAMPWNAAPAISKTSTSTSRIWASASCANEAGSGSSFPTLSSPWRQNSACARCCKTTPSIGSGSAIPSMPPWTPPSSSRRSNPLPRIIAIGFVQARPLKKPDGGKTQPEKNLEKLPTANALVWHEPVTATAYGEVRHTTENALRVHDVPLAIPLDAHKRVFFEPRPGTLRLFEQFNRQVKNLVAEWWEKIEDSRKFAANMAEIQAYHRSLRPGDVTLVGLIAEGGQGMRTANNARFLAYLEGTPQARDIEAQSQIWTQAWLANERIQPAFNRLLRDAGGNPDHPLANRAAWESAVHGLRKEFTATQLGFGRTALFRIAPRDLIATEADFQYSFQRRKQELLTRWREQAELRAFWDDLMDIDGQWVRHTEFRTAEEVNDQDFCTLCQHVQLWVARENASRRQNQRISRDVFGLRSSEDYSDPADAPRIATIYNGLYGRAQFVSFRKGDPEGSRWLDNEPLFIDWSHGNAVWMFANSGRREPNMPVVRNAELYLTSGVTWSLHANHVAAKCRYQEPCIFDASSSRLTPIVTPLSAQAFVTITNSDVFSFFLKKFIKHNQDIEINDMRSMPVVIPSPAQHSTLRELATLAMSAKRHEFAQTAPDNVLVSRVREIGEKLRFHGPAYLHPSAQGILLAAPADCLEVIEKAVDWEAEKLYGVEGLGPFDEF